MTKQVIVPATEELTRYKGIESIHYTPESHITVTTLIGDVADGNFSFDYSVQPITHIIAGAAYTELKSANPAWAPLKPEGYYREDDIWYILEEIEKGNLTSELPVTEILLPE